MQENSNHTKFALYVYNRYILTQGTLPKFCSSCDTLYRVEQEACARRREGIPYVKVYRYNPKHLYPKLNGLGDNGQ